MSQPEKCIRQKGDTKQIPYWDSTDIRRHIKKNLFATRPGDRYGTYFPARQPKFFLESQPE